jgi:threonine/homoserine/homoserine lactone efflux protein
MARVNFLAVVLNSVAASLTGVMMPGAMTAATLSAGLRRPHAGAWVAIGHAVVEVPLIVVLMWVSGLLHSEPAQIVIGLAGGAYLAWLGAQGLWDLRKPLEQQARPDGALPARPGGRHPFVVGIVLSGGNPGFLLWWGTAGLLIATSLMRQGWLALGVFAVIHWLCDLVWLEALSLATFKGTRLLGARWHKMVLGVSAAAILLFAAWFFYDAGAMLAARIARYWGPGVVQASGLRVQAK